MATDGINSSNLENVIDKGLEIAKNLSQLWLSYDCDNKRKLQTTMFPGGMVYSKKSDVVRTDRVNFLVAPILRLISFLEENKESYSIKNSSKSTWVVPPRIELGSKV